MSASGIVISRFDCEESRHRFYFWTTLRTLFCREYIGLCGSTYVFLPFSFHLKCFAGRRRVQHARPDHFAAARSELSVGDRLLRERAGAAYRHTSLGWESLVPKRQFSAIPSHAVAGFVAHPRPKLTKNTIYALGLLRNSVVTGPPCCLPARISPFVRIMR